MPDLQLQSSEYPLQLPWERENDICVRERRIRAVTSDREKKEVLVKKKGSACMFGRIVVLGSCVYMSH